MAISSNPAMQSSTSAENRVIRLGFLGFGTVGQGTYRMLVDNADEVLAKTGTVFELAKVGVRDLTKDRGINPQLVTDDLWAIVNDPSIDVVLELMGGESPAGELVLRALENGKHVVTANKELIAKNGSRLVSLAKNRRLDLHFEAAVGGGIPVVQPLKHQLAGNDVIKLMGILNGTTNYILTQMEQHGADFSEALAEAQEKGYAEADPTADVDGFDTMYKISILAAICFGRQIPLDAVHREGIRSVGAADMHYARHFGYRIKLLGICEETSDGEVLVRVHPALIPLGHQLANVNGVYNALWLHGDFVGDLMFSGRGAGADPTASAVVGDLIDVARNIVSGGNGSAIPYGEGMPMSPICDLESRYYVRFEVADRPGTLGEIAMAFSRWKVGLSQMEMVTKVGGKGEIAFMTHVCREGDFTSALDAVGSLPCVTRVESWFRVES
ncbi:MAG: homoserine dehydrogenase [Armatimonadetes bacterium]|nr:homoserine dehydrogenase [Armatimonadota bacterium]MBX3109411.1 homoserine dehydrogenase [Fimbriimonadaceae bacterium]